MTDDPTALTPVHLRNGIYYKREDLFRFENGVNGSKLRVCHHLISRAAERGATTVVSAASVHSPQSAMGAEVARRLGLRSITVVGGTTPEKACRHRAIRSALESGSRIIATPDPGFNAVLQRTGREVVDSTPGAYLLPYGISTPPEATETEIRDFVRVGAPQVENIPRSVRTIVLPFGSGNSAAGVLAGLDRGNFPNLRRVVLMTIGPDRRLWLEGRLNSIGVSLPDRGIEQIHLYPKFATYEQKMPETLDEIRLHPTYEGKIARYLRNLEEVGAAPRWWRRDDSVLFWIVGGPL